jgi:hypothetical protein
MRRISTKTIAMVVGVAAVLALTFWTASAPAGGEAAKKAAVSQGSTWREVKACDQRKTVVVEGYPDNQPLPEAKARQVASLLGDLIQYCNEEVRARITREERIYLSVNGSPFVQFVPGGPLPLLPVQGKVPTAREMQIWKAELARTVDEGNKLFHNSKLGTNGISCDMCHPNASNTHPEAYPKFQTQLKKVALLRDMINWCIENPLEGKKLAEDDPQMKALEAYILAQRSGKVLEAGKH